MKMLYIGNVGKKVNSFSYSAMAAAKELGIEFHIACNWGYESSDDRINDEKKYGIFIHQIDFSRKPYSLKNIRAYKQLINLIKKERFDFIHCNTPTGGVFGRLAGHKCKTKCVIYQAHGFHFYKGSPVLNWLLFYPIEKWLAHKTDILLTINKEDFELANKKMHLKKGGLVKYVPGVGIDVDQYSNNKTSRILKRDELGVKDDEIMLIATGDLIKRKNYTVAIEAVSATHNSKLKFFICGEGPERENILKTIQKCHLNDQVFLLGFRNDVKELLCASDIFLFTSNQEGLSRSLMEAMASGLPCVVSNIRGNVDLFDGINGCFFCQPNDINQFANRINEMAGDWRLRKTMSIANIKRIIDFSTKVVTEDIKDVYSDLFVGGGITIADCIPDWAKKRLELNIPLDAFVLISVGELNKNKNNSIIIKALHQINDSNIHYLICGEGPEKESLSRMSLEFGLNKNIHFLGFRNDVKNIFGCSDLFIISSFREGLSRSLMEAMASGLPCVVSNIRGNVDLIDNDGGSLFNPKSACDLKDGILHFAANDRFNLTSGERNYHFILSCDYKNITNYLKDIYKTLLTDD